MAESKLLLQPARQLYSANNNNNNNEEVQVYFNKKILKEKHIYLALVFLGKKLGGSEKALLAFKTALVSKPNMSLAWKSLADYDEQYQDAVSKSHLLSIYIELLKLKIDNKRIQNVIIKIAKIGFFLKDIRSINCLLNYLDKKPGVKMYVIAKYQIFELLKANILNSDNDTLMIESYIARNNLKQSIYNSICIELGKIILKRKNIAEAFAEVTQWPFFSSNTIFRNWLCKYLCVTFTKYESFQEIDIEKYKDIITTGIKNSKYPDLLNSMILYSKNLYVEAFILYTKVLDYDHVNVTQATHVLKCSFKIGKFGAAELLAKHFLRKAKNTDDVMKLKKLLLISYAEQKKWKQAVETGKEITFDSLILSEQAMLAKCYIESGQNADQIIEILRETQYYIQLQGLSLMKQGSYMDAINILRQDTEDPVNVLYIAKSYWELKYFRSSYTYIIKAFILNYNVADVHFYMGMYYLNFNNNIKVALICLEKAYQLNNLDVNTVKNLSDLYIRLGLNFRNFLMLKNISNYVSDQSWIHYRLGNIYLEDKNWDKAIQQLLKAIRIDPKDIKAHENLAQAFYSKGYLRCAINIYFRTIRINTSMKSDYLNRIARIQMSMKDFDRAIFTYQHLLRYNPYNLEALKGISAAWIFVAKSKIGTKYYHIVRDAAQAAVDYTVRILSIRRHRIVSDFWTQLGIAIMLIAKLPDDFCFVKIKCDNGQDLLNLGTLYIRSNICKLGKYLVWRGKTTLPVKRLRSIDRQLANDIFDAEEAADLFRYSFAPDLGLQYTEWVAIMYSREEK